MKGETVHTRYTDYRNKSKTAKNAPQMRLSPQETGFYEGIVTKYWFRSQPLAEKEERRKIKGR